jgi:hypothetical protein
MMYSSSQMKFQAGRLSALRCHNLPFWEHFESAGCTLSTVILHSSSPPMVQTGRASCNSKMYMQAGHATC